MTSATLTERVRDLVGEAERAYAGTPDAPLLSEIRTRLAEPLRVAIAGRVKAGKSTLLNAMVGELLAPTGVGECTQVITWYRAGPACQVTLVPAEGDPEHVPFARNGTLEVDLEGRSVAQIRSLVVDWPSARLEGMTLIDTPGLSSLTPELSRQTDAFLAPENSEVPPADAVIYLMRHLHSADARALEAFQDREVANPTPINALGVLARADEIGVARPDAMNSAREIARHYSADPTIRRLCQMVVPVCGLLAEAATSLREVEYQALRSIADLPADSVRELLLSVHHFIADDDAIQVGAKERAALLDRLGLFGVRVSVEYLQGNADATASDLASHLGECSGIRELQRMIHTQFEARSGVLKAHSALNALGAWLDGRSDDPAPTLATSLERVRGEAHEFEELRLYAELRAGAIQVSDAESDELEALLGGAAATWNARLGLAPDIPESTVRAMAMARIEYWQRRAENPLTSRATAGAARVIVRTYEGVVADLAGSTGGPERPHGTSDADETAPKDGPDATET